MSSMEMHRRQFVFRELVFSTLVYAVVLGFFEDYTAILDTWSYSVTFLVAVVMAVLTYLTFWLKRWVVKHFSSKEGNGAVVLMGFLVWLILFLSKFVFLAVINLLFGEAATVSGFVGLVLVILTMTVVKKGIDEVWQRLG